MSEVRGRHTFSAFRQAQLARPKPAVAKARPVGRRPAVSPHHRTTNVSPTRSRSVEEPPATSPANNSHLDNIPTQSPLGMSNRNMGNIQAQNLMTGYNADANPPPGAIGSLRITVVAARGLRIADVGGTSDP